MPWAPVLGGDGMFKDTKLSTAEVQAIGDLRYLKLDCSNDPLTADELDFQHNNYGVVLQHGYAELSHSIGLRAGARYLRLNDAGQLIGTGVNQFDVNDNAFQFVISDGRGFAFKMDKWTGALFENIFYIDTVDNKINVKFLTDFDSGEGRLISLKGGLANINQYLGGYYDSGGMYILPNGSWKMTMTTGAMFGFNDAYWGGGSVLIQQAFGSVGSAPSTQPTRFFLKPDGDLFLVGNIQLDGSGSILKIHTTSGTFGYDGVTVDGTIGILGEYTLPATDGADGYVLTSHNDGTTTWEVGGTTGGAGSGEIEDFGDRIVGAELHDMGVRV